MAWYRDNITTLANRISGDITSSLGLAQVPRKSVLNVLAKVFAGAVHGLYGYGAYIAKQNFPDSADGEHLERHASWWGINRKQATNSKGAVVFTGTEGALFPIGVRITSGDMVFISRSSGFVGNGQVIIDVESEKAGIASNLVAGTKLSLLSPVTRILHEGEIVESMSGGTNIEDDTSLRKRLLFRVQNTPSGGSAKDYELWALSQEKHGVAVTKAWVRPLEMGIGTVSIRFLTNSGIPSENELQKVKDFIETVRPICTEIFVLAPIEVPLFFQIAGLNPASYQVQQNIEKELKDLILRESKPNSTLRISQIREAISIAVGEVDHELISPIANVEYGKAELCTFGGIEWV